MITNNFAVKHQHEEQAVQMLKLGASKGTITCLLGYMPRHAEIERKTGDYKSVTRVGKRGAFLESSLQCWRFSNLLWQAYASLTNDLHLKKEIDVKAMIAAYNFIKFKHHNINDHVDFNRWYAVLSAVREQSVYINYCNKCGSPFIAKRTTLGTSCSCCYKLG